MILLQAQSSNVLCPKFVFTGSVLYRLEFWFIIARKYYRVLGSPS